jgi:N-acetylglucosamine-6-phosphate deacetylase
MPRTCLVGADVVLPDRVVSGRTIVIDHGHVTDIVSGSLQGGDRRIDLHGHLIVPGFIDVHVHGVSGKDALDGAGSIGAIAASLPRWGVTAFCPTTIACAPQALETVLVDVGELRARPLAGAARVLPAHLESNFINPEARGAQPLECLRVPAPVPASERPDRDTFSGADILGVIHRHVPDVGILTLAPELDGGLGLIGDLVAAGVRVSLGHSDATFEVAQAAIAAGASQATHLFNRTRPMAPRDPGLTGAVLASEDVAAELICDGHHVHPAVMRVAIASKGPSRMMAITDGTAGSGLARGSRASLGGRPITVAHVALLDDGTFAGSVLTMDKVFACLVTSVGVDLVRAAEMCATTPARELGLHGFGSIAPGAVADLTVLDRQLVVRQTWIGGELVYERS